LAPLQTYLTYLASLAHEVSLSRFAKNEIGLTHSSN